MPRRLKVKADRGPCVARHRDTEKTASFVEQAAGQRADLRSVAERLRDALARFSGVVAGNHSHVTQKDCDLEFRQVGGWANHLDRMFTEVLTRLSDYLALLSGKRG